MVDGKETIYIDIDDEITGIIDKVKSSKQKIVALVLPKRATVFHSIVNMKLLQRAATDANKRVVLITSEAGLLPMAGAVGLHVAKTLQSRPAIPDAPDTTEPALEVAENDMGEVPLDKSAPVGELAGLPATAGEDETIQVDNADKPEEKTAAAAKPAKNRKLKVPNFEKFRTRVFLAIGLLILLIVGWIFAAVVLPKANVTIKTDTQALTSNIAFTASPKTQQLKKGDDAIVPAEVKTTNKTDSTQVSTTGQKDNGTKATGKVTLSLTDCSASQVTVPAGTAVSASGFNFITQSNATLSSIVIGGNCRNKDFPSISSQTVNVTAQNAGDKYNLSSRPYTVSGFSNVSGQGTDMAGGTSSIIKIVAQSDIDGAKQKIIDQDSQAAKDALTKQLQDDGFVPISDTFGSSNPVVSSTPNVGDQADQVTVNVSINFTMLGAQKDGTKQLIEDDIKQHIDTSKQTILDNGLDKAIFQVVEKRANGDVKLTVQAQATAGVAQDVVGIKRDVAGKKKGDAQEAIQSRPGVKEVTINYSPFWVSRAPKKLNRITVTFQQTGSNANQNP